MDTKESKIWYSEFIIEAKPKGAKRFDRIVATASTYASCLKKMQLHNEENPDLEYRFRDINTNFTSEVFRKGGKK